MVAELAGLPEPKVPQPIDGISLVPVLKDPSVRVRDHAFHAYPRGRKLGRAIRTERYRFVEWKNHSDATVPVDYELYDYETDPWEIQNHYTAKPDVAKKLKAILDKYPAPKTRK